MVEAVDTLSRYHHVKCAVVKCGDMSCKHALIKNKKLCLYHAFVLCVHVGGAASASEVLRSRPYTRCHQGITHYTNTYTYAALLFTQSNTL
jgi:hypothetical protein